MPVDQKVQMTDNETMSHTYESVLGHIGGGRVNILSPRQNGRHFPDDMFNCIFLHQNVCVFNKISLTFLSKGPINNIPALVKQQLRL